MHMIGLSIPRHWEWPRPRLSFLITFVVGTALLAGAIHIIVILLVPYLAQADGWSRLAAYAGDNAFAELPADGSTEERVAGLDPLFINGACRLSLADTPAAITVDARDRFWSVALYDPQGTIIFSLNDRTAVQGRLDMIVLNPFQNGQLRESPTVEIEQTIVVESPSDDLIAILRLFAPTIAAQQDARRILAQSECLPDPTVIPTSVSG
jgi:uncharacterized membrane protein